MDLKEALFEEKNRRVMELIESGRQEEAGTMIFSDPMLATQALMAAIHSEDLDMSLRLVIRIAELLQDRLEKFSHIKPVGDA